MNSKTFSAKEFWFYSVPVMVADLVIHILVFEWIISIFRFTVAEDLVMTRPRTLYFLIVAFLFAMVIFPVKLYERRVLVREILANAFLQTLTTIAIFSFTTEVMFSSFAGKLYLQEGILATALITCFHLIVRLIISKARSMGRNKVHAVVVGGGVNARKLAAELDQQGDYKFLGFFNDEAEEESAGPRLGSLQDVLPYIKEGNKLHEVYCSVNPALHPDYVNSLIRECENSFITFYYVPNMEGYLKRKLNYSELGGVTVMKLWDEPLADPMNSFIKRLFDILFSSFVLVTIYPFVWLFVAIGTTITSPGPILFRQQRSGYKAKPFTMLKFRSMKPNVDADRLQATEDDPRKTAFGNFLRRSSIDELPQFINVFKGDMSLIGPRPHMILHTETYSKLVDEYLVRHMVRPGLTGWAQVNGARGETKTVDKMADRVRKDIWYIEHWSPMLDIKIFFMTIFQIFKGDSQAY
ncbi:MAG: undecaprenyl-phosphate glucose phosphotransferase [Bacteroidales bacterium]|nr:undecaprenyl-phosphate glucose phosphotransferase [Bacteroidales bacterium]